MLSSQGAIVYLMNYVIFRGKSKELKPIEYYGLVVKSDTINFIQLFKHDGTDILSIESIKSIPAQCFILNTENDTKLFSVVVKKTTIINGKDIGSGDHIEIYATEFEKLMKFFDHNEILKIKIIKWGQC